MSDDAGKVRADGNRQCACGHRRRDHATDSEGVWGCEWRNCICADYAPTRPPTYGPEPGEMERAPAPDAQARIRVDSLTIEKFSRVRVLNALHRLGAVYVNQVPDDITLLRMPRFGKKALSALRDAISAATAAPAPDAQDVRERVLALFGEDGPLRTGWRCVACVSGIGCKYCNGTRVRPEAVNAILALITRERAEAVREERERAALVCEGAAILAHPSLLKVAKRIREGEP